MPITVFDAVGKFSADTSDLDQFIVKLEQGLSSASEKAAASTQALKEAQDEFRDAIRAISAESGDTTENLTRLAEAEKNLTLAAAAAKQEHSALKRQLLDTGDAGGDAGKKMDYSFREARGSIALTGAELGVHLPRELSMLLAHIPAVGAAFSMMLPIIGVVAAIKLIGDLVEKHENLAKAQQRAALGTENLAIKEADQTRSMELANLKLDDQIAKLEGRPDRNKLKEALIEAGIAADGLATKFAADFEKIDEDLDATTGWLGRFTQDMYSLKSLLLATPETFSEAWHKATKGGEDVAAALSQVHAQLVAINLLRAKPPGNTEEEQVKQQEALAAAYEEMGK